MSTKSSPGGKTVDGWIPFTQFLLPNGTRKHVEIHRPEVATLADIFINAGGKFECEMLSDYQSISLTAGIRDGDGEWQDIAIRVVKNGPSVPVAVSELVEEAAAFLKIPQSVGTP